MNPYKHIIEEASRLPFREWEVIEECENVDGYTVECIIRTELHGLGVLATGYTVHGDLVEISNIEMEQLD